MIRLTAEGEREIDTIAARHAVPSDVVKELFGSVVRGGGSMAQFNIAALGGSGQWMRGGMTMVGDMFNDSLRAKVASLCEDLAVLASKSPFEREVQPAQQQMQSSSSGTSVAYGGGPSRLGAWWPEELGSPTATGVQNDARYAYFPATQRLAVEIRGRCDVYDIGDHRITGFGQQQGVGGSITFTSQRGLVNLSSLPMVERTTPRPLQPETPSTGKDSVDQTSGTRERASAAMSHDDILSAIERLGALHKKGHLSEAEFQGKKAELLARL